MPMSCDKSEYSLESLAPPLAEALAKASADQEVTFAVAYRLAGMGRLASRRVATGRLFISGNGLNLIAGLLQTPFEDEMRATGSKRPLSIRTNPSPETAESSTETDKYHRLEQSLEMLKRLWEKGLISDEAYERKSRQILDDL